MRIRTTVEQIQGSAHTFDGAAPASTATKPAAAQSNDHALYSYADSAHAGLFNPNEAGSPAKVRYLERLTIHLNTSTAWALNLLDQQGTPATRVKIDAETSQDYDVSFDPPHLILPGETLKFTSATYGTVTMTFGEDA